MHNPCSGRRFIRRRCATNDHVGLMAKTRKTFQELLVALAAEWGWELTVVFRPDGLVKRYELRPKEQLFEMETREAR